MRAFVTGATGFIGRRLIRRLRENGYDIAALVRDVNCGLPEWARLHVGCLPCSVESLSEAMHGSDVVFHLAARVSFDPLHGADLMAVNAEGTANVLAAAARVSVSRVVVVSSACTIGLSSRCDRMLDEETPYDSRLALRNPYLRSKRACEEIASCAAEDGLPVVVVNPTTVFGPGDDSLNSGTLVRQIATAAVLPVPPGGSNVVDVEDVVDGIIAAGKSGRSGSRYILGGHNLHFSEIFSQIADVVGRRPVFVPMPAACRFPLMAAAWFVQRFTGSRLITPQIVADTFAFKFFSSRKAETELGWRARSDFTSTLAAAWEYYQDRGLIARRAGAVG